MLEKTVVTLGEKSKLETTKKISKLVKGQLVKTQMARIL